MPLLPHIPRDTLDGRRHLGHHALGLLATTPARLPALCLRRHRADRVDVRPAITGHPLAIATPASLQIDQVIRVAEGTEALRPRLAWPDEAVGLLARGVDLWRGLLQTGGRLRGAARAVPLRRRRGPLSVLLHLLECLFSRSPRLCGRTLCGGPGDGHGRAQLRLPREQVGGVRRTEGLCDIRHQSWGLVARRLDDMALERSQGLLQLHVPGVVLSCLGWCL
jgi:hypothetical protein